MHLERQGISGSPKTSDYAVVYYYLFVGVALLVGVYLFLPRASGT